MCRVGVCAAIVLTLLVGCQTLQSDEAKLAIMQEKERGILAECELKRLNGQLRTYAESTQCSNPVIIQAHLVAGDPAMDLVYLLTAFRLAVAERMDAGTLTRAEGNLMIAQLLSRINTERVQRDTRGASQGADTARSYPVLLKGLGTWLGSVKPPAGNSPPSRGGDQATSKSPVVCYWDASLITCH